MTLTAKTLIDDAIALAYPHIGPQKPARGTLLRQLSALDASFAREIANSRPELLSTVATAVTITGNTGNATGYALQTGVLAYVDFRYYDSLGEYYDLYIVPEKWLDDPQQNPSAVIRGSTLFPCDPNNEAWAGTDERIYFKGNGDKILYSYIAMPSVLTYTGNLVSPDFARDWFVWQMVVQILIANGADQLAIENAVNEATIQASKAQMQAFKHAPVTSRFGEGSL